jgi:predicted Rossmann fold flavoprotein
LEYKKQMSTPLQTDVLILGAGGAGMMCAIHAGRRGRKVVLLDHAKSIGGKILISGGGRCNFTNTGASPAQYVSKNLHFCKSALSRYQPSEFIELVEAHGIQYHEKKLGQLFCDASARQIVDLLRAECGKVDAQFQLSCRVLSVSRMEDQDLRFRVETSHGTYLSNSLVIATGGLSIPKIGATGLGYEVATQFGLKLIQRDAALDGFTLTQEDAALLHDLAGVSVDVVIEAGSKSFRENILFTHAGLSGPAALQASLHWHSGDPIEINLLPEGDLFSEFRKQKSLGNRSMIRNFVADHLSARLAARLCEAYLPNPEVPLPQVPEKIFEEFCNRLHHWRLTPSGTVGYSKAEVTRGGVDTDELSSKTMESKKVPGLYFVGEVVDVTGWLGGYNFQWAWASGFAAGQVV